MEVLAFDRDEAVLELLVHFLGIATHHNINAAPSKVSTHKVKLRAVKQLSGTVRDQDTGLSLHPINVRVLQTATQEYKPITELISL
jgi:hypothetical protein